MKKALDNFLAWCRTDSGRKKVRYFLASVITTIFSQAVLFLANYGRIATAVECSVIATAAGAVPSYYLNRAWAWGRSERSHLMKEVVPFWALAFFGLFVSIGAVDLADGQAKSAHLSHLAVTVIDNFAYLMAFVVVWVIKFIIFDKLVFVDHQRGGARAPRPEGALEPAPLIESEIG